MGEIRDEVANGEADAKRQPGLLGSASAELSR